MRTSLALRTPSTRKPAVMIICMHFVDIYMLWSSCWFGLGALKCCRACRPDQPGYIVKGNFRPGEVEARPMSDSLAVLWVDWEDSR